MMHRMARVAMVCLVALAGMSRAAEPVARQVAYLNYSEAVELRQGTVRAVVGPQAGGRVLAFSRDGASAMWFDEKEKKWTPDQKPMGSAGRFDYGPELVVKPHPAIWSGTWSAEITGTRSVRLTSLRDTSAGVQLIRDFELDAPPDSAHLSCTQTIVNLSNETQELCHWGRSFSPGGGIALVPLGDRPSRFPSKYAMYEDSAVINVRNTDERIRERDGFLEILAPPRKPKLGFDSYAGWFAYLMPGDLLFVKRFRTYPNRV
ncbi:MAG TPA: esterase, partial [Pirellulales bacterium]|nr:esterase [Pirellulales bacterium]